MSRQPDEQPQAVKDEPRPARRADSPMKPENKKASSSKRPNWLIVLLLVVGVALLGWLAWSKMQPPTTEIDSSKYQVVTLVNGELYFGKLEPMNDQFMKLTKAYYMQTEKTQPATTENSEDTTTTDKDNYKLVKFGSEVHGPEDTLVIAKEQILYYQNLKSDGQASQLIKQDSGK